ncbi:hypothetical protein N7488_004345 [Penicillium malachiteum]|nr:hypothetical protein N7488_004345 [Penicillium malachiteum]
MSGEPPMPPEKKHASCRLSQNQEKKVLEYCSQYLDCGHISLKGCAGRIGNALYHKPKKRTKEGYLAGPLNKNWGANFCSRYPELKAAIDKGKKSARLSVKASAADFKVRLVKCIEKYNIQPDNMYAVEEWGLITTKYADRQKMTLHRPSNPDHEPRNLASTILCISRKGRFLTPYLITKGKKSADFEKKSRVWLGSNPNGWADEFDFAKWFQYFETKTRRHSNRKTRPWLLLLVEGHRSPITEQCFVRALKKRIIIFSYPRHKAGQLDPFCCGVLDYLERRFVEWLTPRWEERSTRGEEIVEIESLDLAATVSWFTVAGKDDSALTVEREFEIRTAWAKCVQNWIRGGDLGPSKEIKPTVVKVEQGDKESDEDHAETESENEGPSDQPSIQNKTENAGSVRTQTTNSGPFQPTPVEFNYSRELPLSRKLHLDLKLSPSLRILLSRTFHLSNESRLGLKPLLGGEVHLGRQHLLGHKGVLNQSLTLGRELYLRKILSFDCKLHVNHKLLLSYKVLLSRIFDLSGKPRLGRELSLSLKVHLNRKLRFVREHPFKVKPPRSRMVHIDSKCPLSGNLSLDSKLHIGSEPRLRQTLPPNHEHSLTKVTHTDRTILIMIHHLQMIFQTKEVLSEGTVGDQTKDEEERTAEVVIHLSDEKITQDLYLDL